ncbi:MAG: hypothetical protein U9M95_05045 [Candidatus Altiarchaeota archaeon]|nr:hypothetical protein [Candidatus Altiarchaeota archaeon]
MNSDNSGLYYKQPKPIRALEIERLKLENHVLDESGERPVAISVVVPTFNKNDTRYNRAVLNVISTCGSLIDEGVIDEVVIADGSRTDEGKVDMEFMEFLLSIAIKYSKTFEREVDFVGGLSEGKLRALQGRYDFSFRIQSQIDPELHRIYLDQGILNQGEIDDLKNGKGANMWFSVPVTYGDIICFVDSDIISFRKHYVKGLCQPILKGWNSEAREDEPQSSKVFSKAAYIRLHKIPKGFKMGGRLSRLFGIPMLRVLNKHDIFPGLNKITYPFSGECAFTRYAINKLQFSNGYDIETSVLCQLWKEFGIDKVAEYNFGFFRHLPGEEEHADEMLGEISMALFYWLRRYGFIEGLGDFDSLIREYENEAGDMIDVYKKIAEKIPSQLTYEEGQMREDSERIKRYMDIIKSGYTLSVNNKPKLLRPWEDIKREVNLKRGYSYATLKSTLQSRVNKFTSNMILSYIRIYVDRSNRIISQFIE